MSIIPADVSTIRLGQLPSATISLTDKIPHEVGSDLKSATIEELSIFIASYIGASDGVGFRFPIAQWEQTGTTVTFLGTSTIGKRIDILTFTL